MIKRGSAQTCPTSMGRELERALLITWYKESNLPLTTGVFNFLFNLELDYKSIILSLFTFTLLLSFLGFLLISLVFITFFSLRLVFSVYNNTWLQPLFIGFYNTTLKWTMRWAWTLGAWRILINPIRSWSSWSRRNLDRLIFRNPSLNKNWAIFVLHQKRKSAPEKETDFTSENTHISRLICLYSRLL